MEKALEIKKQDSLMMSEKIKERTYKMAQVMIKERCGPDSFDTPQKMFMALTTALGLGYTLEQSQSVIGNMYFIKNRLSLFGDLPLAIVKKSGLLEYIDEHMIDKEYTKICLENKNIDAEPIAAVCIIKRKGMEKKEFVVTKNDLKTAGINVDKNGVFSFQNSKTWPRYPKIHWKYRARSMAIKSEFSDVTMGNAIYEYDHHQDEDIPKEKVVHEKSKNMLDMLNGKKG